MPVLKKSRALVTGATGFVGSHLVKGLLSGGWEVHALFREKSKTAQLDELIDQVVCHHHDGTMEGMLQIFGVAKPDVVFHLASCFLAQHRSEDVLSLIESNLHFGTQLLEAMQAMDVYRLVNTGTAWQHYRNEAYNPVNLYAATKEAFEAIIRYYIEAASLKVITLKLYDTYGSDDPRPKLFSLLKRLSEEGGSISMSPGEQLIDMVHVSDVVSAFLMASKELDDFDFPCHKHFAVSSGNPVALKEFVVLFEKVAEKKLSVKFGERPYRPREVMVPWNNGDPLPGWRPLVSLPEGIMQVLNCQK